MVSKISSLYKEVTSKRKDGEPDTLDILRNEKESSASLDLQKKRFSRLEEICSDETLSLLEPVLFMPRKKIEEIRSRDLRDVWT